MLVFLNKIIFPTTIDVLFSAVVATIVSIYLLRLRYRTKKLIVPRCDSYAVIPKTIIGILSITIAVFNHMGCGDGYSVWGGDVYESLLLLLIGSISVLTAYDTFIGSCLLVLFLSGILVKTSLRTNVNTAYYLFVIILYIIFTFGCSIDYREKWKSYLRRRPKKKYTIDSLIKVSNFDIYRLLQNDRVIAVSIDYPYPLKVFYIFDDSLPYIQHQMSDGSICYVDNYCCIKSFNYSKYDEKYRKSNIKEKSDIVNQIDEYMKKNTRFISCRYYGGSVIRGYRKKYPNE